MAAHRPGQAGTGVAGAMISSPEAQVIPRPGRYEIDTSCSAVTFRTRHLFGLAPVRGSFTIRAGTIDVAEPLADSSIHVHVDPASFRTGNGFGLGSGSAPLEIAPSDYEAFERLLGDIQAAWSNEDVAKLHTLATPEMVSYLSKDLSEHKAQNVINKTSDVKLLQGDLAEAWREGDTDYASVAMRFSLVDKTLDRATGRLVSGSEQPAEVTEVWTFVRPRGANWELSAIQQA